MYMVRRMDIDWLMSEDVDAYQLQRLFYFERYAWLSLSPDMCAVISIDGQFEDVNTHWEETTGIRQNELQSAYLMEHIHFDDRERTLAAMQQLITSDIGSTSFSFRFLGKDGRETPLNWNVIYSPDHSAYFCTASDPSKSENAYRLAYRDVLTGLPNRLALEESLPETLSHAADTDTSVAVIFIDLDGFKEVNDTLGHKAGDTLLMRAARRMNHVVGTAGTTYRQGGDEFIVVLDNAGRSQAAGIAGQLVERLRAAYDIDDDKVNTGASMGIAIYPTDGDSTEEIMEAADQAMYSVKRSGKNNFEFHSDIKG